VLCNSPIFPQSTNQFGSGNFGFNISGGSDQQHIPGHSGIFISRIRADGPAAVDGKLSVGDRILSVNGTDLTNVGHQEAVDFFRQRVSSRCCMTVEKGAETRILHEPVMNLPNPNPETVQTKTTVTAEKVSDL